MCIWIIYAWSIWLKYIICTCGWHPLPSNYHSNCIRRRPYYFFLEISNAFQNTILTNTAERVYLSLPYLYLDWYKRKCTKHSLASINQKESRIHTIKSIQGKKPSGKLWYDLLKSIFIVIKMNRRSSEHAVFSWVYKNYKSFFDFETD